MQQEKLTQEEYALKLEKREHFLADREAQMCRHEAALTKIRGVEQEVHAKFQIMKEVVLCFKFFFILIFLIKKRLTSLMSTFSLTCKVACMT